MSIDVPRHGEDPPPGPPGGRGPQQDAAGGSPGLGSGPLPRVLGGVAESVSLPAELSSARLARKVLQRLCRQVGLSEALAQEAAVLTSEVVTNAVRHAGGAPHLSVVVSPAGVYVEVQDGSPALPPLGPQRLPPSSSTGGRGLAILHAWADSWGACPQGDGKVVWFALRAT